MQIDQIPFRKTGYFSPLICDYLDEAPELREYYNRFPTLENFKGQIAEKTANFSNETRAILVAALQRQYAATTISEVSNSNMKSLADERTFTVTTGHQLNLFTGPLYFLYKIISAINLAEQLKEKYNDFHFVPVYWMASEDHDFDEINYFNFKGKKIQWNQPEKGAVGKLDLGGLDEVFEVVSAQFGTSVRADELKSLFKQAYVSQSNLTEATRFLANELFGAYGLVIIDGDDADLKRLLIPAATQDIFQNTPFKDINESIASLQAISDSYKIQVNPREINYFYLKDGLRKRIIKIPDGFAVNDTDIVFTTEGLQKELEEHPERFSPNVIARPLYQEIILPNLCYIGGGGELAYWLELKSYFDSMEVTYPMILLRNSVLVVTEKQRKKAQKLKLSLEDLFMKQSSLINKKIREVSNIEIDFSKQKKHLENQFEELYEIAEQTDTTFLNAVKAQEVKQKNGLDALEKRLLKAQKRKLKDHVIRLSALQNQLFPQQSLQERQLNFSELFLEYGDELIPNLKAALDPFTNKFLILGV